MTSSPLDTVFDKCKAIMDDRAGDYGDPRPCFEEIARRWSLRLKATVTPHDVAMCMAELKMVRDAHKPKSDHKIDGINFLAFADLFDGGGIGKGEDSDEWIPIYDSKPETHPTTCAVRMLDGSICPSAVYDIRNGRPQWTDANDGSRLTGLVSHWRPVKEGAESFEAQGAESEKTHTDNPWRSIKNNPPPVDQWIKVCRVELLDPVESVRRLSGDGSLRFYGRRDERILDVTHWRPIKEGGE